MAPILSPGARPRPVGRAEGGAEGRAPGLRLGLAAALACALVLAALAPLRGHEIPPSVTVLAFVKPEGGVLRVLMRVPVEALRDVELPLRAGVYLDVARAEPLLHDAARIWLADYIALYEDGARLAPPRLAAARVSLPSDRAFARYETALVSVRAPPLASTVDLPWKQAMLDVALEYSIRSERARFDVRPALAHLGIRTATVLRFLPPGGAERAFQLVGDPGLVRLDPRWHQAAARFVALGFRHILDGIDHLLFVLCLVIPVRRLRPLVAIVTSFTVAHSITLAASALGLAPGGLWFPPLVEVLVAVSIVYMALENIVGARVERRWILAFGFGLVHGFAFSFALRESMQFAGAHLATALLAFNAGVELAQLAVVALAVPALALLFRRVVAERMGTIIASAIVAHTAWH
ncbi:MAG: HupE/UreJ family protein, partial [Gemmatimonadaceae bacterium]